LQTDTSGVIVTEKRNRVCIIEGAVVLSTKGIMFT
jgi:hypothetical protein